MPIAKVHRISAASPDDVSGIEAAIAAGRIDPKGVIAVLGKTEGNGLVNDFARGYAALALSLMFQRHLPADAAAKICLVMSGGTEGGMAPHWTVFERGEGGRRQRPGARVRPRPHAGVARRASRPAGAGRYGRGGGARGDGAMPASRPRRCAFRAGQMPAADGAAHRRSRQRAAPSVATTDTLKSMGLSRAASALGVAVALGEIDRARSERRARSATRLERCGRAARAARRASNCSVMRSSCSACRPRWCGPLAIDHAVMADAIDIEPVRAALARLGLAAGGQFPRGAARRLVAVLAKAEASHDGRLRGYRHTMLDDFDISSTRHARAFVCGALAGARRSCRRFMSPAAPSIRARTAAGRWR